MLDEAVDAVCVATLLSSLCFIHVCYSRLNIEMVMSAFPEQLCVMCCTVNLHVLAYLSAQLAPLEGFVFQSCCLLFVASFASLPLRAALLMCGCFGGVQ